MLAERRSGPALSRGRFTQTICEPQLIREARRGFARLANHISRLRLSVFKCIVEREHWFAATVGVAHQLYPIVSSTRLEDRSNFLKQIVSAISFVVLARHEVLASHRPAEIRPKLRLECSERHEAAIARLIHVIKRISTRKRIPVADG